MTASAYVPAQRLTLDWTTYEVTVLDLGLACCGVEVMAALHGRGHNQYDLSEATSARAVEQGLGATSCPASARGETAHVLVVSGTVTDVLLPAVLASYRAMPEPRYVLSVGACCNTGGPYWDSYSVTKGIDQMLPVHVAVPGCPPRPEAILDGLVALHRLVGTEGTGLAVSEATGAGDVP